MTEPKNPDQVPERLAQSLDDATRAALDRLAARRRALAARSGGPQLGELYVFEDLALDATVSWALVIQHPDDADSFLAVPADDHPLAGGDDVEVPPGDGSGPLTLRCGHATWIGRRHLTPARLDGWVDAVILAEARAALRSVATGDRRGGFEQREIEATADYEDWIAVIAGAEARLSERLEADERAAETRLAGPVPGSFAARIAWGPAPARAASGIVQWPEIELAVTLRPDGTQGVFALVDGVTDPEHGTSFRLLQFAGPRSPAIRLVLAFLDERGQIVATAGAPDGVAPGQPVKLEATVEPRMITAVDVIDVRRS